MQMRKLTAYILSNICLIFTFITGTYIVCRVTLHISTHVIVYNIRREFIQNNIINWNKLYIDRSILTKNMNIKINDNSNVIIDIEAKQVKYYKNNICIYSETFDQFEKHLICSNVNYI